jgi:hypothetical protein
MELQGSLPHSQVPAICLYSERRIGPSPVEHNNSFI